jgi:nitrilase
LSQIEEDSRRGWIQLAGNWPALKSGEILLNYPGKTALCPDPEEWINPGDSAIVAPGDDIIAGPLHKEQVILYAEIKREQAGAGAAAWIS